MTHEMNDPDPGRLEALAERASQDPFFLGSLLAAHQRRHGLDDGALAAALGCAPEVLVRLRLCRRPGVAAPARTAEEDGGCRAGSCGRCPRPRLLGSASARPPPHAGPCRWTHGLARVGSGRLARAIRLRPRGRPARRKKSRTFLSGPGRRPVPTCGVAPPVGPLARAAGIASAAPQTRGSGPCHRHHPRRPRPRPGRRG
jgi:hypothetical protein